MGFCIVLERASTFITYHFELLYFAFTSLKNTELHKKYLRRSIFDAKIDDAEQFFIHPLYKNVMCAAVCFANAHKFIWNMYKISDMAIFPHMPYITSPLYARRYHYTRITDHQVGQL